MMMLVMKFYLLSLLEASVDCPLCLYPFLILNFMLKS